MPTRRAIVSGLGAGLLLAPIRGRAATGTLRLSMGSPMPRDHPATTCLMEALDAIRAESRGEIDITLQPDSRLGGELSMQSQLRAGTIAFTLSSASSLQALVPIAGIPGLAYAFTGYVALWSALDRGR